MTVEQMIEKLSAFPPSMEVVLIVDAPEEFPRAFTDVVASDFDEIDRVAILTKMEEV